eukprot:6456814-Amphidinium_carterae.2
MVVADKNKAGEEGANEVDYKEFMRLMQETVVACRVAVSYAGDGCRPLEDKVLGADPKDNVLRAFAAFDTNCDKKISLQDHMKSCLQTQTCQCVSVPSARSCGPCLLRW